MITVDAKPPTLAEKVRELFNHLAREMRLQPRQLEDLLQTDGLWLLHPEQQLNWENEGLIVNSEIIKGELGLSSNLLKRCPPMTIMGAPAETNLDMPPHTIFLFLNRRIVGQIRNLPCPADFARTVSRTP